MAFSESERKIVEKVIMRLVEITSKEPFKVRDRVKDFIKILEKSLEV